MKDRPLLGEGFDSVIGCYWGPSITSDASNEYLSCISEGRGDGSFI